MRILQKQTFILILLACMPYLLATTPHKTERATVSQNATSTIYLESTPRHARAGEIVIVSAWIDSDSDIAGAS